MSINEKKEFLLEIIEEADERLLGLLIALANEYNSQSFEFTTEELEGFDKVKENLLKHPESGMTVEEAHQRIRENYKNKL
jgi:hypothetical protein